jgi:prepilin-type processing-associated H-X9-DG protein
MNEHNKLPFSISTTAVFAALTTGLAVLFLMSLTTRRIRTPSIRNQVSNCLKQIGLGMHGFADRHKTLPPPAIYDKDGKPLLSWRVLLLPYIEQQRLYDQFHLDEPWDSPHNLDLLKYMPPIYEHLQDKAANDQRTTYFRVFVGPGAAFEGPKGIALHDFADGTGTTLLVVEAAEAVPWSKPAELPYAPEGALPKLGGRFTERFHVLFADGSVAFVPRSVDEDRLRGAITRNGGEMVAPLD